MGGIEVITPGSAVRIADSIDGTLLAMRIDPGPSVTYLVSWWDGRVRHEQWLSPVEFSPIAPTTKTSVGFRSAPSEDTAR